MNSSTVSCDLQDYKSNWPILHTRAMEKLWLGIMGKRTGRAWRWPPGCQTQPGSPSEHAQGLDGGPIGTVGVTGFRNPFCHWNPFPWTHFIHKSSCLYVLTDPKWVPFQMLICEVNKWKGHEKIHLNIVSHNDSGSLVVEKNSSLQRNPTHHSVSCGEAARNGGFLHIKCTRSHLPPDDNDGNWQASPLSIIVKLRL